MGLKANVIKGWITSMIGVATMVITLILVYTKAIDFVWSGIGGLVTGCVLLLAPKTVERKVSEFLGNRGGNGGDRDWNYNHKNWDNSGNKKTGQDDK